MHSEVEASLPAPVPQPREAFRYSVTITTPGAHSWRPLREMGILGSGPLWKVAHYRILVFNLPRRRLCNRTRSRNPG